MTSREYNYTFVYLVKRNFRTTPNRGLPRQRFFHTTRCTYYVYGRNGALENGWGGGREVVPSHEYRGADDNTLNVCFHRAYAKRIVLCYYFYYTLLLTTVILYLWPIINGDKLTASTEGGHNRLDYHVQHTSDDRLDFYINLPSGISLYTLEAARLRPRYDNSTHCRRAPVPTLRTIVESPRKQPPT